MNSLVKVRKCFLCFIEVSSLSDLSYVFCMWVSTCRDTNVKSCVLSAELLSLGRQTALCLSSKLLWCNFHTKDQPHSLGPLNMLFKKLERAAFYEKVLWAAFGFLLGYMLSTIIRMWVIYYMMTRKKSVLLEAAIAFLNMVRLSIALRV